MDKKHRMTAAEYRNQLSNKENFDNKTALRNRASNDRGKAFENLLMKGCRYYRNKAAAVINKVYEPYICTKVLQSGQFMGRFLDRAEPDFKGVLAGGQAIAFEAKSTQKSRIQYDALTTTQLDWLAGQEDMGAITFVAVNIQNRFFSIPFGVWEQMRDIYGKKYLVPEDITEYEVIFDGAVRFLEYENGKTLLQVCKHGTTKEEVIEFVDAIIGMYQRSEKCVISSNKDCCQSDTIQSLDEECNGLRYAIRKLTENM